MEGCRDGVCDQGSGTPVCRGLEEAGLMLSHPSRPSTSPPGPPPPSMLLLGTSLVKLRMNTLQVSLCQPESERVGSFHPVGPLLQSQVAPSALCSDSCSPMRITSYC